MNNMHLLSLIIPIISAVFIFIIGIIVFIKNRKAKLNILFTLFCLAVDFWMIGTFFMFINLGNDAKIIFWDRFVYIGVVFIPVLIYHFSLVICNKKNTKIFWGYIISSIFLILSRTKYFVDEVFIYDWGAHTKAQIAHHLFLLFFFIYFLLAIYNLFKHYNTINDLLEKNRIKYILFAFVVFIGIGSFAYLPAYSIGIYPIPFMVGVFFSGFIAYAILRYRLMDFKVAVTRSIIYIFLLIIFVFVFSGLIFLIIRYIPEIEFYIILFLIIVIGILGFFPLKKIGHKIFFKEKYSFYKKINIWGDSSKRSVDVDDFFKKTTVEIKENLDVKEVKFLFLAAENNRLVLRYPLKEKFKPIFLDNELINYFKQQNKMLIREEIPHMMEKFKDYKIEMKILKSVDKIMKKKGAEIVVPFYLEGEIMGMLWLGGKSSDEMFSKENIDYLVNFNKNFGDMFRQIFTYEKTLENISIYYNEQAED